MNKDEMRRYLLEIKESDSEDIEVAITGKFGITPSDITQVFGFCISSLLELGAQPEDLKALIDAFGCRDK